MRAILGAVLIVLCLGPGLVGAQDYGYDTEMSMEEYNAELNKWQERQRAADSLIAGLRSDISSLKKEITSVEQELATVEDQLYSMLADHLSIPEGRVEAHIEAYLQQLETVIDSADGLMALSPENLYRQRSEVESLRQRFAELQSSVLSQLDSSGEKIAEAEQLFQRIQAKMPKAVNDIYSVKPGDYLWKIAGKEQIYNNPYEWVKIWSANRDQIENPDLIYPDQKLDIRRRLKPNEIVVREGETLKEIAERRGGNPFDWQDIYQANRQIIQDPNMLYPHQILKLPTGE